MLVLQNRPIQRRQDSNVYLDWTGDTEPNCATSSLYTIQDGRLLADGKFISAPANIPLVQFSASEAREEIDTIFGVTGDTLFWDNPAFDGGTARFCIDQNSNISAVFNGDLPNDCSPIVLRTRSRSSDPQNQHGGLPAGGFSLLPDDSSEQLTSEPTSSGSSEIGDTASVAGVSAVQSPSPDQILRPSTKENSNSLDPVTQSLTGLLASPTELEGPVAESSQPSSRLATPTSDVAQAGILSSSATGPDQSPPESEPMLSLTPLGEATSSPVKPTAPSSAMVQSSRSSRVPEEEVSTIEDGNPSSTGNLPPPIPSFEASTTDVPRPTRPFTTDNLSLSGGPKNPPSLTSPMAYSSGNTYSPTNMSANDVNNTADSILAPKQTMFSFLFKFERDFNTTPLRLA
ncbi:uncharacterized protein KY384_008954 [Bacidia gigantensis]|uniref:uncharacterized protein n=1 Tax=Bacidia gigantensis TaxID=2732470 RepID=UPI001D03F0B1|nr:uncharacterized protein KY384_008954 [Bacidia gigantensis]KAG8525310.1 hypothetical protein KY384_008954 [Bacidia gigantensis]